MSTTPIDVPSYLSDEEAGIATAAVSCGNGCMAEQDDPCGTGEWCSECSCQGIECGGCETAQTCSESCSQSSCGSCMSWTQDCGTTESGGCDNCEGWCESSNQCSCESGECSCQSGCQGCQTSCQSSCQGCQTTCENSAQRPGNASWVTAIAANSQIKLTAAEWNAFTAAINSFRTYKGLGAATFTAVAAGDHIKQEHFTQARSAINDMSPPSPVPDETGIITAASLNGLMASLNSIT